MPATYSNAIRSNPSGAAIAGALQAISIGGMTDWLGHASQGRELQAACYEDTTDGYPAGMPSLRLDYHGFWRFFWGVTTGTMSMAIWAKQAINQTPRPSVVLKANAAVGIPVDTSFLAASDPDWAAIPISFVATATGLVVVELHNNLLTSFYCPCLFSGPQFGVWSNGVPLLTTNQSGGSAVVTTGKFRVSAMQERSRTP